jgi:hypothetical protein
VENLRGVVLLNGCDDVTALQMPVRHSADENPLNGKRCLALAATLQSESPRSRQIVPTQNDLELVLLLADHRRPFCCRSRRYYWYCHAG